MNRNPISVDLSLLGVCLLIIKIWMGWFKAIVREPSNMAGVFLWDIVFVIMCLGAAFFFLVLVHDIIKLTEERKRGIQYENRLPSRHTHILRKTSCHNVSPVR